MNEKRMNTIKALLSDHLVIRKSGRKQNWSLTRMSLRKRQQGKTIDSGRLRELQKLINNSEKKKELMLNECRYI